MRVKEESKHAKKPESKPAKKAKSKPAKKAKSKPAKKTQDGFSKNAIARFKEASTGGNMFFSRTPLHWKSHYLDIGLIPV